MPGRATSLDKFTKEMCAALLPVVVDIGAHGLRRRKAQHVTALLSFHGGQA